MDPATLVLLPLALAVVVGISGYMLLYGKRDPATLLKIIIVCLLLITARLVVPPMGAIGTPAIILGLAALAWWGAASILPSAEIGRGRQPARWIVLGYAWYLGVSYVAGHSRALTALEVSGSDREMIRLAALCGVALLAADGIRDRDRLDSLLRFLVWLGGLFALIGLIQFFFKFDLTQYINLPGLGFNGDVAGFGSRSNFARPASTSLHPIEFSVVLCMLLPLAMHFTLYDSTRRGRRVALLCALLIATGIPMSLSRTGIIALVIMCLVVFAGWTWHLRLRGIVAGVVFGSAMYVLIPGLLGSIRSMFTRLDSDPSVTDRVDRMPRVMDLWSERFWLGRGTGTYSPEDYFLLDNQLYVTAIENGMMGIIALVGFLVAGIWLATVPRRRGADPATANLGQSLAAALAAVLVTLATFDALFFHILTMLTFLFIGCAGALWRIHREEGRPVANARNDAQWTERSEPDSRRTSLSATAPQ